MRGCGRGAISLQGGGQEDVAAGAAQHTATSDVGVEWHGGKGCEDLRICGCNQATSAGVGLATKGCACTCAYLSLAQLRVRRGFSVVAPSSSSKE